MILTSPKDSLTTKEAAELSGYNPDYLGSICRSGKVVAENIDRQWFINRASFEAFVQEQENRKRELAAQFSKTRAKEYRSATSKYVHKDIETSFDQSPIRATVLAFLALLVVSTLTTDISSRVYEGGLATSRSDSLSASPLSAVYGFFENVAGGFSLLLNPRPVPIFHAQVPIIKNASATSTPSYTYATAPTYVTNNYFSGISTAYLEARLSVLGDSVLRELSNRIVFHESVRSSSGSSDSVDVSAIDGSTITNSTFSGSSVSTDSLTVTNAVFTEATTTDFYISGRLRGVGLSSCSGSSDKLLWNFASGQFSCGVDAGAGGGITGLKGQYSSTQTGATQTLATTSDTNLGLTITSSGDTHTFTPTWIGTLAVSRGGTGSTTLGGILTGNGLGGLTSAILSAPLVFSSNTLSITQSSAGADGYLSTSDWILFNNKVSSSSLSASIISAYPFPNNATTTLLSFNGGASTTALSANYAQFGGTGTTTFTTTGFLGMGTTSPWAFLSVNPTAANNTNPAFAIGSSTNTTFLISNSGLVSIGSTSPFAQFSINGTANGTKNLFVIATSTNGNTGTSTTALYVDQSGNFIAGLSGARVGIGSTSPYGLLSIDVNPVNASTSIPYFAIGSSTVVVTNTGNVGIGIANPLYKLHVYAATSTGTTPTDVLAVENGVFGGGTTGSGPAILFKDLPASFSPFMARIAAVYEPYLSLQQISGLAFYTSNSPSQNDSLTERLRITGTGNVGIGTTTPKWTLTVASSTGPQLALSDGSLSQNPWTFRSINGNLYIATSSPSTFATSTVAAFMVDTNGKIGIATSSPYARLSVSGTLGADNLIAHSPTATSTFYGDFTKYAYNGTTKVATLDSTTGTALGLGDSNYLGRLKLNNPSNSGNNVAGLIDFAYNDVVHARINTIVSGNYGALRLYAYDAGTLRNTAAFWSDESIFNSYPLSGIEATTTAMWVTNTGQVSSMVDVLRLSSAQTNIANTPLLVFDAISGSGGYAQWHRGAGIEGKKYANTSADFRMGLSFYTYQGTAAGGTGGTGTFSEKMTLTSAGNLGVGTTTPQWALTVASSTAPQIALSDGSLTSNHWTMRNINGNFYIATASPSTFATSSDTRITIASSGNVGIGTTTPQSNLSVIGSGSFPVNIDSTGGTSLIRFSAVGVNKQSFGYTPTGSAGLGILDSTGNNWRMLVTDAGNVGIGTTTPQTNLVIGGGNQYGLQLAAGAKGFYANPNATFIENTIESSGGLEAGVLVSDSTGKGYAGTWSNHSFVLRTTNADRVTIDTIGNVGISTTTPLVALDVYGGSNGLTTESGKAVTLSYISGLPTLGFNTYSSTYKAGETGYGGVFQYSNATGDLIYYSGSNVSAGTAHSFSTPFTIKQAGNISIGTSTNVTPDANGQGMLQFIGSNYGGYISLDGSAMYLGHNSGSRDLRLQTNETTRLSITGAGDVGIGGTPNVYSGYTALTLNHATNGGLLDLNLNGVRKGELYVAASAFNMFGDTGVDLNFYAGGASVATLNTASNLVMTVTNSSGGNTNLCWDGAGASIWGGCTSLRSYKEHIEDLELGLETVRALRPVTFDWKSSGTHDLGFIAEEVADVNPLLAEYTGKDGALSGVKYNTMSALTVKAIQELDIKLEDLASTSPPLPDSFTARFFARLVAWFADTTNGIGTLAANAFTAKERICVDDQCLTKDDIRSLLEIVAEQNPQGEGIIITDPVEPETSVPPPSELGTTTPETEPTPETPAPSVEEAPPAPEPPSAEPPPEPPPPEPAPSVGV